MPRQVVGKRLTRGGDQALCGDATSFGFAPQIGQDRWIWRVHPRHAVFDRAQQAHPNIEHFWRDLVGIVEATEYKGIVRQTAFTARRNVVRSGSAIVVDVIALGQPDDLLGVIGAMILRDDRRIGDDIVEVARSHGAGIGEIIDLNGRGTMRKYTDAIAPGEPRKIDQNIDFELPNELGDLAIAALCGVDVYFKSILNALCDLILTIHQRNGDWLESRAIVLLEHARDRISHRVPVKISRHVGDTNFVVCIALAVP